MAFGQLVGHNLVKDLLSRSLSRKAVHGAYLFTGPPGVGKHLAAAAFARAWLCLGLGAEPCGVCDSCRRFAGGAHQDLLEVSPDEKKKSISIDQVRDCGVWLAQSPALGRRKAAIIDPADTLRIEGANALLKTLEEPPPGRVVVLVAARAGALPPTVRSRCQQVTFGALTEDEVAEVLRHKGWPARTARQAAALAEGSPGTALQRDGRSWQETAEAVSVLFEALAAGERGAALAFAESAGEGRERTLALLQAIIGFSRRAARRRLGDQDTGVLPPWLAGLDDEQVGRLLEGALEVHRRLEGDRPPNAKLALATLLVGAGAAGARQ